MNISINLDETQMSKLINDGINALDADTVKDIAKKSLCKAFENEELAKQILFERPGIYGSGELRRWAIEAISKSLTTADYEEFRAAVFSAINAHAKDIIIETLAKTLTDNLFTYQQQRTFGQKLVDAIKGN